MKLLVCAGIPLVIAVALGIASAFQGNFLVALIWIGIGIWIAAAILLGYLDSLMNPAFGIGSTLIAALSIFAAFHYSKATNFPLQRAYQEAMEGFLVLGERCAPITPPVFKLADQGAIACAYQGNSDMFGLVVNLGKALYYGPTMSLLDGVMSIDSDVPRSHCAVAFVEAEKLCKNPFPFMKEDDRNLLRATANER